MRVVILWNYKPKHVTDLAVKKGERLTALYRNGELAFVENAAKQQGYIPICYCSLYRRRSSSLSEFSSELVRKIAQTKDPRKVRIPKQHRKAYTPEPGRRISYQEDTQDLRKAKSTERMPSKGTYYARPCDNRQSRTFEKGLLNSAAKKLRKVFSLSSVKSKKEPAIPRQGRALPNWLEQLEFDNNNSGYSSSSESSDEDEIFEPRQRTHSDSASLRRDTNNREYNPSRNEFNWPKDSQACSTDGSSLSRQYSTDTSSHGSQDVTTGYATVRRLKTASSTLDLGLKRNSVALTRSSSFSQGDRPRSFHATRKQTPLDLIEVSESCENLDQQYAGTLGETSGEDEYDVTLNQYDVTLNQATHGVTAKGSNSHQKLKEESNEMIVMTDFITGDAKDLDCFAGQKVYVLNRNNTDWWLVESEDGRGGFVPSNHLICIQREDAAAVTQPASEINTRMVHDTQTQRQTHEQSGPNASNSNLGSSSTAVKLARITPTVRETLPSRQTRFLPNKIVDLKQEMDEQIEKFEVSGSSHDRYQTESEMLLDCELDGWKRKHTEFNHEMSSTDICRPDNVYITAGAKKDSIKPSIKGKCSALSTDRGNMDSGNMGSLPMDDGKMGGQPVDNGKIGVLSIGGVIVDGSPMDSVKIGGSLVDSVNICGSPVDNVKLCGSPVDGEDISRTRVNGHMGTDASACLRLPSYEQLMAKRTTGGPAQKWETSVELSVNRRLSSISIDNDIKFGSRNDSNLINDLMGEWRQEQKKLGKESYTNQPESSIGETSSTGDSSSQASFDSTEPKPRALRRRSSLNKKVRFQTPADNIEHSTENCCSEHETKSRNGKILATWL